MLNHTSDQHAWFLESESSRDNPRADWYIWYDTPPNNWQSCFDGDAWTYVPERDQYYYHYFMKQQPDLNWRNPAVKQAMWDAVRFWLDLGVDGFRLDAVGTIFEDPDLTPHTVPMTLAELRRFSETAVTPAEKSLEAKYWREMFQHQWGGLGLHDLMKELRAILDAYPGDRMLVGEDDDIAYLGNGADELHLVFNFPLMRTERITPAHIRANQAERLAQLRRAAGTRLGLQHAGQPRFVARLHPVRHLVCGCPGGGPAERGPGADAGRHALPLQRRGDRHDRSDHHRSRQVPRHHGDLVLCRARSTT